jgi:nucleoside 2-deoxyribosyltransferase
MDIKEVVSKAIESVKKCDLILVEASEKASGAYFEVGYAKALRKKVIIIHRKGTETNFLDAAADASIEYDDFEDLKGKLKKE